MVQIRCGDLAAVDLNNSLPQDEHAMLYVFCSLSPTPYTVVKFYEGNLDALVRTPMPNVASSKPRTRTVCLSAAKPTVSNSFFFLSFFLAGQGAPTTGGATGKSRSTFGTMPIRGR